MLNDIIIVSAADFYISIMIIMIWRGCGAAATVCCL